MLPLGHEIDVQTGTVCLYKFIYVYMYMYIYILHICMSGMHVFTDVLHFIWFNCTLHLVHP